MELPGLVQEAAILLHDASLLEADLIGPTSSTDEDRPIREDDRLAARRVDLIRKYGAQFEK